MHQHYLKIHTCQHHLEMDKYVHNYPALRTSAQLDESLHIISDHPLNSHQDNVTADWSLCYIQTYSHHDYSVHAMLAYMPSLYNLHFQVSLLPDQLSHDP